MPREIFLSHWDCFKSTSSNRLKLHLKNIESSKPGAGFFYKKVLAKLFSIKKSESE